jgi:hypothetical protein
VIIVPSRKVRSFQSFFVEIPFDFLVRRVLIIRTTVHSGIHSHPIAPRRDTLRAVRRFSTTNCCQLVTSAAMACHQAMDIRRYPIASFKPQH